MRLAFAPYSLKFHAPAGTSRGTLLEKPTWFLKLWDEREPEIFGIGEAALFPGLSAEDNDRYVYKLVELLANVAIGRPTDLSGHSSIQFGFEQAIRDLSGGGRGLYFPSDFTEGKQEIMINGLIWMGSLEEMKARIYKKLEAGFRCIKLKIGSLDWGSEVHLLEWLRAQGNEDQLTIRVDANGAFSMENALPRLERLHNLGIHSIEQPIRAGQPELTGFLCSVSPTPIALDEELIGISDISEKERLLDTVMPQYIILKPALCGGFSGAEEWIRLARDRGIGWWVTSALESNIGLSAIAQWCGTLNPSGPQGLGTGTLYSNNLPSCLELHGDCVSFSPGTQIDRSVFDSLDWRY